MTKNRLTRLEGLYARWKRPDAFAHVGDPLERAIAQRHAQRLFDLIGATGKALLEYDRDVRRSGGQPDPKVVKMFHDGTDLCLAQIEDVLFM
jgi:hypothetical protein